MMGKTMQDTKVYIAQTFSQDHRPRYLIGRAKAPHMIPATMANVTPIANVEVIRFMHALSKRNGHLVVGALLGTLTYLYRHSTMPANRHIVSLKTRTRSCPSVPRKNSN